MNQGPVFLLFLEKMIAGIWKMYHNRENAYILFIVLNLLTPKN
jgi:hypothetical protein